MLLFLPVWLPSLVFDGGCSPVCFTRCTFMIFVCLIVALFSTLSLFRPFLSFYNYFLFFPLNLLHVFPPHLFSNIFVCKLFENLYAFIQFYDDTFFIVRVNFQLFNCPSIMPHVLLFPWYVHVNWIQFVENALPIFVRPPINLSWSLTSPTLQFNEWCMYPP